MLAARVIPVMLCKGHQLVKGTRFVNDRIVGHALQAAKVHAARQVDELMLIDVDAWDNHALIDCNMVRELTRDCFTPVTVGGGVRSVADVDELLRAGADKVLIGHSARYDTALVEAAAERFGSQAIVVSVDHPWRGPRHAAELAQCGAGEILFNNIGRDGMLDGFDVGLIREVASAVSVPVIACGGYGNPADALAAIMAGASAVAIGAAFAFTDQTPRSVAQYLHDNGVTVRL